MISIKRVYEPAEAGDGQRVLVDRIWPRGLSREAAALDLWLKDVAPSTALRQWFGHDPAKWVEFQQRYRAELAEPAGQAALAELRHLARRGPLTLVFGARNTENNQAVVLKELLARSGRG